MYWSRAIVTPRSDRAHSSEYRIHQLVADLFGQYTGTAERPYVWRARAPAVTGGRGGEGEVLILSSTAPALPDGASSLNSPAGQLRRLASRPYPELPREGATLDFDLVVNATTRLSDSKRRLDVYDAAVARAQRDGAPLGTNMGQAYTAFLARQLRGGATLSEAGCVVVGRERRTILGPHALRDGRVRPMTSVVATLHGSLVVQDAAALGALMLRGVGHQRALGCGLLCLLPGGTWGRQKVVQR